MRKLAVGLQREQAEKLADYLFTKGIETHTELAGEKAAELWVRDEDLLPEAREIYDLFMANPGGAEYDVAAEAKTLRRRQQQALLEKERLQRSFPTKSAVFAGKKTPAAIAIIVLCVVASLSTAFGDFNSQRFRNSGEIPLTIKIYDQLTLSPVITRLGEAEGGPFAAVAEGQIWRLVTPIFLHADPIHLLFNCLFLFVFGRLIEVFYGSGFLVALFLLGGVGGILAQALLGWTLDESPYAIGASGGALALFSFVWLRPLREPLVPFRVSVLNVVFILGFVLLSMTSAAPVRNVANLAHIGGLVVGAVVAMGLVDFLRRR